ncbi:hypothetical protein VTH82DRAFT_6179 [Thermothelomyces myriococcoides]
MKRTYNIQHSLVVTDPTTTWTLTSLTQAERTGCRAFWWDNTKVYVSNLAPPRESDCLVTAHINKCLSSSQRLKYVLAVTLPATRLP